MTEPLKVGTPVITRDGRPARIICDDRAQVNWPLVACVGGADEYLVRYHADGTEGRIADRNIAASDPNWDLVRKPRTRDVWIVIGPDFFDGGTFGTYGSAEMADSAARSGKRIIKHTITEGQYDPASPIPTED